MDDDEKAKIELDLADRLRDIKKEELPAIFPKIPEYVAHEYELVRVEAVELIGDFKLKQFLEEIKSALNDKSELVRKYALSAIYDLIGSKSAPFLEKSLEDPHPQVVTNAATLLYLLTDDTKLLDRLLELLKENHWEYTLCSTVFSVFETYTSIKDFEEIITFLKALLPHLRKSSQLYKEIQSKILE